MRFLRAARTPAAALTSASLGGGLDGVRRGDGLGEMTEGDAMVTVSRLVFFDWDLECDALNEGVMIGELSGLVAVLVEVDFGKKELDLVVGVINDSALVDVLKCPDGGSSVWRLVRNGGTVVWTTVVSAIGLLTVGDEAADDAREGGKGGGASRLMTAGSIAGGNADIEGDLGVEVASDSDIGDLSLGGSGGGIVEADSVLWLCFLA